MDVNANKVQAAQNCLAYNPAINTVFVTSNLGCFANKNAAVNHARGLTDKEIDVFIRTADEAVIDADQSDTVTNESLTIPDARLAVVNAQPGAVVLPFAKTPAPVEDEPVVEPDATPAPDAVVDATPAPESNEGIISELDKAVAEVERLLHINQPN